MASKDTSRVIDRTLSVNFGVTSKSDQQLKARLNRLLAEDDGTIFKDKSDLARQFLLKGWEEFTAAKSADVDSPTNDSTLANEVLLAVKTIQQQLADVRRADRNWEALETTLRDIDHRTRTLRPAFAAAIVGLLIEFSHWTEDEARQWAKDSLLEREPTGSDGKR